MGAVAVERTTFEGEKRLEMYNERVVHVQYYPMSLGSSCWGASTPLVGNSLISGEGDI